MSREDNMVKKKKVKEIKIKENLTPERRVSLIDQLEKSRFIVVYFVLIFIILVILYKPIVLDGLEPSGSDYVSNIGVTKQDKQWEEETGNRPLWNSYMFGGMPMYQHLGRTIWLIDTVLNKLDFIIDWRIWYFLAGAIGMFLLIKFLKLPAIVGMIAALAFVLMPHFQALIIVGHFAKFRALMWTPYVLLTFLFLIKERSILSGLLFCLSLSMQFRTQHYQIIFYTFLLLIFMGIPPIYNLFKEKKRPDILKLTLFSFLAVVFSIIISSQIFLSIKEYTPHSTRGGYAISLKDANQDQQKRKGVGFDYATMWSYSVSEFWNLIVPKFHGGTSNEIYTGDAYPNLKNRELPTYWGSMPFTQSYEYLGVLIAFFALIGIVLQWSRWEVKSLTFLTLFALIMSLGKNFPILYKTFFYYFPYFDKFRVPMMIMTLVMFNVTILAAFGISFLIKENLNRKEVSQRLYIVSGIFIIFMVIPLLLGSSFGLTRSGEEQRYGQEALSMLKNIRLEMLRESALKSLILLLIGVGCLVSLKKNWLRSDTILVILFIAICFDYILLNNHYLKNKFIDPKVIEENRYRPNQIDERLKADKSIYRVFPVGQLFSDVHWVYHHQSIGGYSPAKLQTIQEIIDNCLYVSIDGELPINWNILKILNVKYVIANQQLNSANLELVVKMEQGTMQAYLYNGVLPRAYFVKKYTVIADGIQRLSMLNNPQFNPSATAILEKTPKDTILSPDSTYIDIKKYEPEEIVLDVFTDKPGLMVLSEIYYPAGWRAILDDSKELEIYKTNHLIRSIIVPEGKHSIKFYFKPRSYYVGFGISLAGVLIIHILTLIFLYLRFRKSQLAKTRIDRS